MLYPPQHLLSWLKCTTYMMEQLYAKSGNADLKVLQQSWEPTNNWDRQVLSLDEDSVLHRDIVVSAWDYPCWFARTILPKTTYDAHLSLFERLSQEPLGNLIFHTQAVQRLKLDYYSIEEGACEYQWLPKSIDTQQQVLWLRCSTFQVKNAELFCLVEILLPDLERYS
jgi:chorismate lyase